MEADRIHKVKRSGNKMLLKFDSADGDELEVKYRDEARQEFGEALQGCLGPALELLELPAEYGETITVTGISFSWTNDVMGAVVTMQKLLQDAPAPLILNTPHLPSQSYTGDEADVNPLLPGELVEALEKVMEECKLFVAGKRAQTSLFEEPPDSNGQQEEGAPEPRMACADAHADIHVYQG